MVLYGAGWYSAARCNIARCSTARCNIAPYGMVQNGTAGYRSVPHNMVQYSTVQHSAALCGMPGMVPSCTVLYGTGAARYGTAQPGTVQYGMVRYSLGSHSTHGLTQPSPAHCRARLMPQLTSVSVTCSVLTPPSPFSSPQAGKSPSFWRHVAALCLEASSSQCTKRHLAQHWQVSVAGRTSPARLPAG